MLSSGAAAPGGTGTLWAGFVTGLLVIAMIGPLLLVGVAPAATGLRRWIVGCTVVYGLVFGGLMMSYLEYLAAIGPVIAIGLNWKGAAAATVAIAAWPSTSASASPVLRCRTDSTWGPSPS